MYMLKRMSFPQAKRIGNPSGKHGKIPDMPERQSEAKIEPTKIASLKQGRRAGMSEKHGNILNRKTGRYRVEKGYLQFPHGIKGIRLKDLFL